MENAFHFLQFHPTPHEAPHSEDWNRRSKVKVTRSTYPVSSKWTKLVNGKHQKFGEYVNYTQQRLALAVKRSNVKLKG